MTKPYSRIKVLIADDHEMVRDGLNVMSSRIEEFEIIAEAKDGLELVQLTHKHNPDVILTDVKMPGLTGIKATEIILKEYPHIGVIALSSFDEENLVLDMLNAGARGYVLKNAGKKELTEAVTTVYKGQPYYSREISQKLAKAISGRGNFTAARKIREQFTEREMEVIELICEGLSSKQIAARLGIKTRTVERYRDNIMTKMEVKNAAGVVNYAFKYGLYKNASNK